MRIEKLSVNNLSSYKNHQPMRNYKTQVSFKGDTSDTFDYNQRVNDKLAGKNRFFNWLLDRRRKAEEEVKLELIGFNLARNALEKEKDQTIKAKEEALRAKEEAVKLAREKADLLERQLELAKNHGETSTKLAEELVALRTQQHQVETSFTKEADEYKRTKEAQKALTEVKSGKGWDRVAGSTRIKKQLEEAFINKLALEQGNVEVSLPNGILIYGPKGTGKTNFAEAFAQQSGCNFVEIDMMQDDKAIINDLQEASENAKKLYKNNNKQRTIILLDEFDSIGALSDEEMQDTKTLVSDKTLVKLKQFINNCADKKKCTLFLTTNHPMAIDSELIDDERINMAIYLGLPSKEDIEAVLKHYMKNQTDQEIDYEELVNAVFQAEANKEAFFSIRRLIKAVQNCVDKSTSTGQKITQQDLINEIHQVGPDLSSDVMERYTKETAELAEKMSR